MSFPECPILAKGPDRHFRPNWGRVDDLSDKFPVLKRAEAGGLHMDEFDEQDMIIVGGPEKCLEKVRRYEAAGVDHLLCLMQAGRLRHEDILESIHLFGELIIPQVDRP